MMVLYYYTGGNLRNYLNQSKSDYYYERIQLLEFLAMGLLNIHNTGMVHKDFHPGNILLSNNHPSIGDLGLCQPVNKEKQKGVYGVLPYVAPEVLHGHQYTKA